MSERMEGRTLGVPSPTSQGVSVETNRTTDLRYAHPASQEAGGGTDLADPGHAGCAGPAATEENVEEVKNEVVEVIELSHQECIFGKRNELKNSTLDVTVLKSRGRFMMFRNLAFYNNGLVKRMWTSACLAVMW